MYRRGGSRSAEKDDFEQIIAFRGSSGAQLNIRELLYLNLIESNFLAVSTSLGKEYDCPAALSDHLCYNPRQDTPKIRAKHSQNG